MLLKTQDFQEMLHEVLDKQLHSKNKQEELLQIIITREEKKSIGTDFQELLRKSVKSFNDDQVKKDLKHKVEDKEKAKKDINVTKQVKSGANVEKVVQDVEKNKEETVAEDVASKNDQKLTSREMVLKYMYSEALDEYYKLKSQLTRHQIIEDDISLDDRNYTKLLMYENYLRKCDMLFKSSTGKYISNQDEEISKRENKYAYDYAKSEKKIIDEHEERVIEVDRLNEQIKDVADKIIALNEAQKNGGVIDYDVQLELLEKEYVNLNAKLHALTPNILELYRQEEKKEEQEKITTRVVGTLYEEKKDRHVLDKDVVRRDRHVDEKEEALDDAVEREKLELQDTNLELANSYVDAAKNALEKEDIVEATKMVERAKEIVGYEKTMEIAESKDTDFKKELEENIIGNSNDEIEEKEINETDRIDRYIYSIMTDDSNLTPVQKQCIKSVYLPEKRDKNVLAREAKENIVKTVKEKSNIKE